jgi:Ger(x)C family germination protein
VVIINKEVAEKGLLPVIDFLIRDHEPRLNEWLLITREQAETILSLESGLEKISALAIADLMRNYYLSSKIRAVNLHEFAGTLLAKTTENTLPIIGVVKTDQEKGMVIEETGIFKSDKLIGYLNKKETRGLLWVLGKTQDGVVVVELPGEEGKVSLEIFGTKSKISSKVSEGKIRFEIDIAEVGSLGEQTSYANLSSREKLSLLENLKAKVIVEEVEAALKKAQECKADIFGLGEYLQRQNRKEWEKVKDNWGELFPHLEVKVKVKTKIRWLGLLTKPTILEQIK